MDLCKLYFTIINHLLFYHQNLKRKVVVVSSITDRVKWTDDMVSYYKKLYRGFMTPANILVIQRNGIIAYHDETVDLQRKYHNRNMYELFLTNS